MDHFIHQGEEAWEDKVAVERNTGWRESGKIKRGMGWHKIFYIGRYDVLLHHLQIHSNYIWYQLIKSSSRAPAELISFHTSNRLSFVCQIGVSIHICFNIVKQHYQQHLEDQAGVRFAGVQPADWTRHVDWRGGGSRS